MEKSLHERLGSTDGIKRIVDDVMAAHLRNPVRGRCDLCGTNRMI
jgi:hypothetical protein